MNSFEKKSRLRINYSQNTKSQWLWRQIESGLVGGGGALEAYEKFDKPKKVKKKFLDMVMFNFARQQPLPSTRGSDAFEPNG